MTTPVPPWSVDAWQTARAWALLAARTREAVAAGRRDPREVAAWRHLLTDTEPADERDD